MGVPLLSTPQTIAEKDTVYNAMKTHLKLSTVKEMEVVPWEELLAAYEICDPKHTFGEQAMIDGEFIDDNWTERFSFLGDGSGEVIVGNTGAEGAVCTVVLSVLPATEPKPSSELIVGALSSVAPTEKISSILQAYNITSTTPQEHIAAALLAIAEDIGWYKAASDFAIQLRKNGTKVFEYSFEQLQPFTGPFKGIAGHSLDLAYLHGNPGIFSLCPEPAREIAIQDAIQRSWITFANGGEPWDGKKTRLFGPGGKVADVSREEVLRGIRRGKAWESLDTLTGNELLGLTGIAVGFCGQLIGTG
jgi:carboxylesterase type B